MMAHGSEQSEGTPDRVQNEGARRGAEAKGGIAPQPGDPTDPRAAAEQAEDAEAAMRSRGFGDHKGASID